MTTMIPCPSCRQSGGAFVGELHRRYVRCPTCKGKKEVDEDKLLITRGEAKKLIAYMVAQAIGDFNKLL